MKSPLKLLIVIFLLFPCYVHGQKAILENRTITNGDSSIYLSIEVSENKEYNIKINRNNKQATAAEFSLKPLTLSNLKLIIYQSLSLPTDTIINTLDNQLKDVYSEVAIASLDIQDEAPDAMKIEIKDSLTVFFIPSYNNVSAIYYHINEARKLTEQNVKLNSSIKKIWGAETTTNNKANKQTVSDSSITDIVKTDSTAIKKESEARESPTKSNDKHNTGNETKESELVEFIDSKLSDEKTSLRCIKKSIRKFKRLKNSTDIPGINDSLLTNHSYTYKSKIKFVEIEFKNGFIERIKVDMTIHRDEKRDEVVSFYNRFPIGVSSLNNNRDLCATELTSATILDSGYFKIKICDVLNLIPILQPNQNDVSPKDGVIKLPNKATEILKKENTTELFEVKIYSDFVGFDDLSPNGLVQAELDKRINLLTTRSKVKLFGCRCNGLRSQTLVSANHGFLNYFEPFAKISKLEENNKFFDINSQNVIVNQTLTKTRYISFIDILQFQNMSTGFRLNAYLINFPDIKSTITFNAGLELMRTAIRDSVSTLENNNIINTGAINTFNLTALNFNPHIDWIINADGRFTATSTFRMGAMWMYDDRVILVNNVKNFLSNTDKARTFFNYGSLQFKLSFKPNLNIENNAKQANNKSEFFFRFGYTYSINEIKKNFFQAQVGYAYYLLKKR